jgi:hypothetical protein
MREVLAGHVCRYVEQRVAHSRIRKYAVATTLRLNDRTSCAKTLQVYQSGFSHRRFFRETFPEWVLLRRDAHQTEAIRLRPLE